MKKLTIVKDETCSFCKLMMEYMEDVLRSDPRFRGIKPEYVDYNENESVKYEHYFIPAFYVDGKLVHDGPVDREKVVSILERVIAD